ncbi:hypothetical protein FQN53_004872 [Emmonsiellopsis sp. PD_33]|nr:hypothetical protein FQN53_004872 [Emmonsiellopsis sp. PD_33]
MSGMKEDCTLATCPIEASIYQYRPSLAANATFIALFSFSGLIHLVQTIVYHFRQPGNNSNISSSSSNINNNITNHAYSYTLPILIGCAGEIIGYVGRVLIHIDPFDINGFLIQICCLTIAPAFYTAAIYFCIADIIRLFGEETSRLAPAQYARIFISCDLVSLILQGAGGGIASVATRGGRDGSTGTNIMIAGLAFQVFSLLVFITLLGEFVWRVRRGMGKWGNGTEKGPVRIPRSRLWVFSSFFSLAILCIFIRCAYRVAELSEGWGGELIREEGTFIGLEGV